MKDLCLFNLTFHPGHPSRSKSLIFVLLLLTFSFAAVIITTVARGRRLKQKMLSFCPRPWVLGGPKMALLPLKYFLVVDGTQNNELKEVKKSRDAAELGCIIFCFLQQVIFNKGNHQFHHNHKVLILGAWSIF